MARPTAQEAETPVDCKALQLAQIPGKLCPSSHLLKVAGKCKQGPEQHRPQRPGLLLFLLGLFCPFFWIGVFVGVSTEMMIFNAVHSGLFMLAGVIQMLYARKRSRE